MREVSDPKKWKGECGHDRPRGGGTGPQQKVRAVKEVVLEDRELMEWGPWPGLTDYATRCQGSSYLTPAVIFLAPSSHHLSPPCDSLFLWPGRGCGIWDSELEDTYLRKLGRAPLIPARWMWLVWAPPHLESDISLRWEPLPSHLSCASHISFFVLRKSVPVCN